MDAVIKMFLLTLGFLGAAVLSVCLLSQRWPFVGNILGIFSLIACVVCAIFTVNAALSPFEYPEHDEYIQWADAQKECANVCLEEDYYWFKDGDVYDYLLYGHTYTDGSYMRTAYDNDGRLTVLHAGGFGLDVLNTWSDSVDMSAGGTEGTMTRNGVQYTVRYLDNSDETYIRRAEPVTCEDKYVLPRFLPDDWACVRNILGRKEEGTLASFSCTVQGEITPYMRTIYGMHYDLDAYVMSEDLDLLYSIKTKE